MFEIPRSTAKKLEKADKAGEFMLPALEVLLIRHLANDGSKAGERAIAGYDFFSKALQARKLRELIREGSIHDLFNPKHNADELVTKARNAFIEATCQNLGIVKSLFSAAPGSREAEAAQNFICSIPAMFKEADSRQRLRLQVLADCVWPLLEKKCSAQNEGYEDRNLHIMIAAGFLGSGIPYPKRAHFCTARRHTMASVVDSISSDSGTLAVTLYSATLLGLTEATRGILFSYLLPRISNPLELFKLSDDLLVKMAKTWLINEKDPYECIEDNLNSICDIEDSLCGGTKRLVSEFGIANFGRYSSQLLIDQLNDTRTDYETVNIVATSHADWTGAFHKWWSEFDSWQGKATNHKIIFVEVGNLDDLATLIQEAADRYKKPINSIHLFAHGNTDSQDLGPDGGTIYAKHIHSGNSSWCAIRSACSADVEVILHGCKSAAKMRTQLQTFLGERAIVSGLMGDGSYYEVAPVIDGKALSWKLVPPTKGGLKRSKSHKVRSD